MSEYLGKIRLVEASFKEDDPVFKLFKKSMEQSSIHMNWGTLHNNLVGLAESNYFKEKYFVVECIGSENISSWEFDSREGDWVDINYSPLTEEDKKEYLDWAEYLYSHSAANKEFVEKIDELKKLIKSTEKDSVDKQYEFCRKNDVKYSTDRVERWNSNDGYHDTTCYECTNYVVDYNGDEFQIGTTWWEEY